MTEMNRRAFLATVAGVAAAGVVAPACKALLVPATIAPLVPTLHGGRFVDDPSLAPMEIYFLNKSAWRLEPIKEPATT